MARTVCYFGTYEADYERNRILQEGLRQNAVTVLECHEPLWQDHRHKTGAVTNPLALARLGGMVIRGYTRLVARYLARVAAHDAVLVGYLGHLDMFLAAMLARIKRKPVVFDAFVSLYDTLVLDRGIVKEGSIGGGLLKRLDRWSCALADRVLLDTEAHAQYFAEAFGVDPAKCRRVLVGADPEQFYPVPRREDGTFTVFHYSKFAPLHGLRTMLEAARLLRGESDIRFLLVGGGQLEAEVERWMAELQVDNVEHRRWMEFEELRVEIASAGACLGIFGDTAKASRVIPNKIYQCMAVGAPIITRDSPGIRELLRDGEEALLCPPADPRALADAILRLRDDPGLRQRLSERARALYLDRCTPAAVARDLVLALDGLR